MKVNERQPSTFFLMNDTRLKAARDARFIKTCRRREMKVKTIFVVTSTTAERSFRYTGNLWVLDKRLRMTCHGYGRLCLRKHFASIQFSAHNLRHVNSAASMSQSLALVIVVTQTLFAISIHLYPRDSPHRSRNGISSSASANTAEKGFRKRAWNFSRIVCARKRRT